MSREEREGEEEDLAAAEPLDAQPTELYGTVILMAPSDDALIGG